MVETSDVSTAIFMQVENFSSSLLKFYETWTSSQLAFHLVSPPLHCEVILITKYNNEVVKYIFPQLWTLPTSSTLDIFKA